MYHFLANLRQFTLIACVSAISFSGQANDERLNSLLSDEIKEQVSFQYGTIIMAPTANRTGSLSVDGSIKSYQSSEKMKANHEESRRNLVVVGHERSNKANMLPKYILESHISKIDSTMTPPVAAEQRWDQATDYHNLDENGEVLTRTNCRQKFQYDWGGFIIMLPIATGAMAGPQCTTLTKEVCENIVNIEASVLVMGPEQLSRLGESIDPTNVSYYAHQSRMVMKKQASVFLDSEKHGWEKNETLKLLEQLNHKNIKQTFDTARESLNKYILANQAACAQSFSEASEEEMASAAFMDVEN